MSGVAHLAELAGWFSTKASVTVGDDLFFDALPERDKVTVGVMELRSPPPHLLQSTSYIRRPRFGVIVRSTAPTSTQGEYPNITAARNMAQSMYQACLDLADVGLLASSSSTSTGAWLFITPDTEPYLEGRDDRNRVMFRFDAQAERNGP